jgi:hypothetical protein
VRQVGYLQKLNRDAWSTKHKVLFTYMFVAMNITDIGLVGSEFSMNMKYANNQLTLLVQDVLLNTLTLFYKIACSQYDIPLKKYDVRLLTFIKRLYMKCRCTVSWNLLQYFCFYVGFLATRSFHLALSSLNFSVLSFA